MQIVPVYNYLSLGTVQGGLDVLPRPTLHTFTTLSGMKALCNVFTD